MTEINSSHLRGVYSSRIRHDARGVGVIPPPPRTSAGGARLVEEDVLADVFKEANREGVRNVDDVFVSIDERGQGGQDGDGGGLRLGHAHRQVQGD